MRELLILADGEDVRDLVPPDENIRLIHIEGPVNVGEKRNFGCERAKGEVVAHWDDDDYSHPERLARQVDLLLNVAAGVVGYRSMRFTDGANWWLYEGEATFALGTSLCYRRDYWKTHPFKAVQVGEDWDFTDRASAAGQLASFEAGEMMYATAHASNTSPRQFSTNKLYKPITVSK